MKSTCFFRVPERRLHSVGSDEEEARHDDTGWHQPSQASLEVAEEALDAIQLDFIWEETILF